MVGFLVIVVVYNTHQNPVLSFKALALRVEGLGSRAGLGFRGCWGLRAFGVSCWDLGFEGLGLRPDGALGLGFRGSGV